MSESYPESREKIVARNQARAEAIHREGVRGTLRRWLLRGYAALMRPSDAYEPVPGSVLLIRPDHLGDVILTLPAIQALKRAAPALTFVALCGPWGAGVLGRCEALTRVLTVPFPAFTREPKASFFAPYRLLSDSARRLRALRFETAFMMRPDHRWGAALANLAGIPNRIGYDLPGVAPFLTHAAPFEPDHAARLNLRLVRHWLRTANPDAADRVALDARADFPVDAEDAAYIESYLEVGGIAPGTRLIALHPGAGTEVKRWAAEKWATVIGALADSAKNVPFVLVLTGTLKERPLAGEIAGRVRVPVVNAAGDTDIGQLAALFAHADLALGPDSGPLHLAAAVGTPTVRLFGPASVEEFGPWGDRQIAITSGWECAPCRVLDWSGDDIAYHPCVRDIDPNPVIAAARRLLG